MRGRPCGNKKINGRKRNIAVDRLGLPWSLAVTSANTSDNEAGRLVVERLKEKVPRLEVIAADQGYKISFINHVEKEYGWRVEIALQRTNWLYFHSHQQTRQIKFPNILLDFLI